MPAFAKPVPVRLMLKGFASGSLLTMCRVALRVPPAVGLNITVKVVPVFGASVADSGAVILFDEWINVPSRHALMLIDPGNTILAHDSIDQLIAILGVARSTISANARLGAWLSGMPMFNADGTGVEFQAGGHSLALRLADGNLSVIP